MTIVFKSTFDVTNSGQNLETSTTQRSNESVVATVQGKIEVHQNKHTRYVHIYIHTYIHIYIYIYIYIYICVCARARGHTHAYMHACMQRIYIDVIINVAIQCAYDVNGDTLAKYVGRAPGPNTPLNIGNLESRIIPGTNHV